MGIVVKQFNGSSVAPKDDAVMNELIFQSYGIFNGCGISFLGVNQLMINSGRMIIKGRQAVITEETIAARLSSGGTKRGRLYIRIDLSSPDTPAAFLTQVADELPVLTQQDDVNYNDGIFEIELCNYDVSETAISNIVESCPIINGSVDMLKSMEELLANTDEGKGVDSLVVKQLADCLENLGNAVSFGRFTNVVTIPSGYSLNDFKYILAVSGVVSVFAPTNIKEIQWQNAYIEPTNLGSSCALRMKISNDGTIIVNFAASGGYGTVNWNNSVPIAVYGIK